MTRCPCPRPEGLSDEEIRLALDHTSQVYRVTLAAGGSVVQLHPTSGDWHVVEWQRCGAIGEDVGACCPCALRRGHPDRHECGGNRHPYCCWWIDPGAYGEHPEGAPTWPVPCWVTTAAEAEAWRPEARVSYSCSACGGTGFEIFGNGFRDCRACHTPAQPPPPDPHRWQVGDARRIEEDWPGQCGLQLPLPAATADDLRAGAPAMIIAAWAQSIASWQSAAPPLPAWRRLLAAEPLWDRCRRWLAARRSRWEAAERVRVEQIRQRERLRSSSESASVVRALVRGELGLGVGGVPED